MKKNQNICSINFDKIFDEESSKVLLNFKIEEELHIAFKDFCEKELNKPVSKVLRQIIKEICIQNKYWPPK